MRALCFFFVATVGRVRSCSRRRSGSVVHFQPVTSSLMGLAAALAWVFGLAAVGLVGLVLLRIRACCLGRGSREQGVPSCAAALHRVPAGTLAWSTPRRARGGKTTTKKKGHSGEICSNSAGGSHCTLERYAPTLVRPESGRGAGQICRWFFQGPRPDPGQIDAGVYPSGP